MPNKLGALSVKQVGGEISSDHKLPGARRRPFADITNTLDDKLRRHDTPSSPLSQPLTLGGMAMQNIGGSKSSDPAEACNYWAESVIPSSPPHSVPLPSSVPCLKGDPIRPKPSVSLGSGVLTQFPYEPGISDGPAINNILLCGAPEVKFSLPSCSGASVREPLSTSLLLPKTHKLACGQLAILPSRSVLVDFREGERRKGRKGDEVMVVSPNGHQVHFYSAPHLSTPCCLAEPIVSRSLNGLSADQYKLYEQAKKVVEHIKRNVPKVVMYESNYVCTLMANEPRADIEIRTNPRSTNTTISSSTAAAIRIRFSRKLRTMQVFSSEPRLCKKTMFCTARGVPADAGDWALLSKDEKECLAALLDFLSVVEIVEGLSRDTSEPPSATPAAQPPKGLTKREAAHSRPSAVPLRPESDASRPPAISCKPVATSTTPLLPPSTAPPSSGRPTNVTISPRPRFPSALPRASSDTTFRKASSTAVSDAPVIPLLSSGDTPSSFVTRAEKDVGFPGLRDVSSGLRLQTRFMPGVGWCVRSGGARYRIMFTDGASLEVDVDEERVEMVEHDGSVVRCTVRECSASRKVGDRMKVFREFLPLFDGSDS